MIRRSRYAWSLCHLVVMIRIASAPTSRAKTPGSGRFLEYLADQQGM
ncbi:mCG1045223 [Mus musculus]|nr:mCG1045223 [Mus musculus]